MKVSFSEQTVLINGSFTFAQMATLEDLLQTAGLEAVESGDADKQAELFALAEPFGIDPQVEIQSTLRSTVPGSGAPEYEMGNLPTGQDSDVISS